MYKDTWDKLLIIPIEYIYIFVIDWLVDEVEWWHSIEKGGKKRQREKERKGEGGGGEERRGEKGSKLSFVSFLE